MSSRSYDQFKRVDEELNQLLLHMEKLEEHCQKYKKGRKTYKEAYEILLKECSDISPNALLKLEKLFGYFK